LQMNLREELQMNLPRPSTVTRRPTRR